MVETLSENITRNILKNWAKETMARLNSMDQIYYLQHKSFVIRIFATILIYRACNKRLLALSKEQIKNDDVWNKVQRLFNKNNLVEVNLEEIEEEFFGYVVDFLGNFCNENYEYLDNMLAWVYQYLNINSIDNINKDTQFFTDQYMVEYLVNKSINELKEVNFGTIDSIDPACGGGNFLVALIEKLYYVLNLSNIDFVKYVGEHIFGYEIDKNLAIICVINMYIKFLELKVLDIDEVFEQKLNIFYDESNKLGALLKGDSEILFNVTDNKEYRYNEVFTNRYTLLITNPPFKGRREQEKVIRDYITQHYKVAKGDICNSFIDRAFDLLTNQGIASFVAQNGWMYLETFKDLRKKILINGSIVSIVDLGSDSFYDLSGEKTNVALLVYSMKDKYTEFNVYGLKQYKYDEKVDLVRSVNRNSKDLYKVIVEDTLNDEGYRIEYLSPGKVKESFNKLSLYKEYARPMQGSSTGDSKKFVKYHWEVSDSEEWKLVSKGGGYCKWSGLNIFKIKWGENGEEINSHPSSVLRNVQYFNETELVYSDTGTSGLSVRLLKEGQIFIASGPGIQILQGDKYCHLAFLNSRLASYYIKVLTPKITISATYIGKIPAVKEIFYDLELSEISRTIVNIKEEYNKKRPINIEYIGDDFFKYNSIYRYAQEDFIKDLNLEKQKLKLEAKSNERVISYYGFTIEEMNYIYSKVGINPYEIDIQVSNEVINNLDSIIAKNLDNNCNVKSTRVNKETLGVEGVLEFLAVNYGLNVEKTFDYIVNNIDEFKQTILHYYKHTLHRIKLSQINYLGQYDKRITDRLVKDIILEDYNQYKIGLDMELWFEKELYNWHFSSFLKKPILRSGDNINE